MDFVPNSTLKVLFNPLNFIQKILKFSPIFPSFAKTPSLSFFENLYVLGLVPHRLWEEMYSDL
jgi:hypothetical protein